MMKDKGWWILLLSAVVLLCMAGSRVIQAATLKSVEKIWDRAQHQMATDLVRWKGKWFCAFREGFIHGPGKCPEDVFPRKVPHGRIRVISSEGGEEWVSTKLFHSPKMDLRGPHLSITPDDELMLVCNGTRLEDMRARGRDAFSKDRTLCWLSPDGKNWEGPRIVGDIGIRLWEVTWHEGKAYSIAYGSIPLTSLYRSTDGVHWNRLVDKMPWGNTEASIVFTEDDRAVCLQRSGPGKGIGIGTAQPPYKEWKFKNLRSIRTVGGPELIRLPDDRIIGAGRFVHDGPARTVLLEVKPDKGKIEHLLTLPSGGDNSYPGLVWHDGLLWVSYYSGHEGEKTSYPGDTAIYLAKVKFDIGQENQ